MKAKLLLVISLALTSCSPRIVRTGYQMQEAGNHACDVAIRNNVSVSETLATKLGEVKIGGTGFSVECSEEHVLEILKREACSMNADLIVITAEKRPNLWSSCYRARAEFYQYKSGEETEELAGSEAYNPENVQERVSGDRWRNTAVIAGSAVIGILISLLLFQ